MKNVNYVEILKQLGFPDYEAKCYQALFQRESLAVGEIAKIGGIPRTSAYDALEQLSEKGLAIGIPGRIKRYKAADPRTLKEKTFLPAIKTTELELEDLEKKRKQKLLLKESLQNNMNSIIGDLNGLYQHNRNNRDPINRIEILNSPELIHNKYIDLYSRTQNEVLAFMKPPYTCDTESRFREQIDVQNEGAKRGIVRKIILEMPPEDKILEYFEKSATLKSGDEEEIKIIDELPIKLFLFDRKTCFVALEDSIKEKTSLTMLATEHKAMAKGFVLLFDSIWKQAKDHFFVKNKKYFMDDFC